MILYIVPELSTDVVVNCPVNYKVIDYKVFNDLCIHPFIATNIWDKVVIKLDKGIKTGFIKQVLLKDNIVEIHISNNTEIDFEIVSRVCEVLKDKVALIKKTFMSKGDVKSILIEEGVIFDD